MEIQLIIIFAAGALGALAKDIIQDNSLKMPKKINGELTLGFLGGMITGGMVGYLVDGDPVTAFLGGYAGTAVIENLLLKKNGGKYTGDGTTESLIKRIAKEEGVDPELAVRVAKCESNLDPLAVNTNADGSKDRGLFQINDKWHPNVSDEAAFNLITATQFFCRAFKGGNLKWWDSSKKCWDK